MSSVLNPNGTRQLSYEEWKAGEGNQRLRSIQFKPTAELISMVEEYEEKGPGLEEPLRSGLRHFAELGREELEMREVDLPDLAASTRAGSQW